MQCRSNLRILGEVHKIELAKRWPTDVRIGTNHDNLTGLDTHISSLEIDNFKPSRPDCLTEFVHRLLLQDRKVMPLIPCSHCQIPMLLDPTSQARPFHPMLPALFWLDQ
jgi:hypothetical protein